MLGEINLAEKVTDFLASRGIEVMMYTKNCVIWITEHRYCNGCPHELGCLQLYYIERIIIKGYFTHRASKNTSECVNNITNAKSVENLKVLMK